MESIHPSAQKGNSANFALTEFSEVHQGKFSGITHLSNTHLATNIYDVAFCRLERTYGRVRSQIRGEVAVECRERSRVGGPGPEADVAIGRIRTTPPVGTPARTGSTPGS